MENLNKIKNKVEEMKAKYSLEQEQEENPNHSDGFGMYWSGFFTCLKEISFFLDSLHLDTLSVESGKNMEEIAEEYSKRVSDGHNCRDLTCGFIAGAQRGAERFAKIVRANLPEIGNNAQSQFEQLYFEITGTKMYGGYDD